MSTTLTNGLKLPDKGSVDWYADMQSNYTILDGAVGTIAEHTSALSGKAPLVHTHTKSDITDFPAYGNTAGTICEGNDSRLSDARTPVAHTHGKADITDLFNSANTWTKDNTYTQYQNVALNGTEIGVAPTSQNRNGLLFKDKNGVNIGWLRHQYDTSGDISIEMLVSNKYTNGALDPTGTQVYQGVKQVLTSNGVSYFNWSGYVNNSLYPYTTETFNIGDSTHQWNNLYAKGYYYNSVAWGLDKENTWSNINSYQREIRLNGDRDAYIAPMWEGAGSGIAFLNSDATKTFVFGQHTTDANNKKVIDGTKGRLLIRTGERNGETVVDFEPRATNAILGTSTNKWKTLNGVNPGALSLPDTLGTSGTENVNYFNVIGYLNNTGTIATIPTTATYDGWLYINAKDGADSYIIIDDYPASFGTSVYGNNGLGSNPVGLLCLICPIRAGHSYNVRIKSAGIVSARIYPAQGNV